MAKENLETKAQKAILKIDQKLSKIYRIMNDLGLKLCHVIKTHADFYRERDKSYY